MKYEYNDEYLQITQNIEDRAIKDVLKLEIKDSFFIAKLTVLRAYILCCLENQTTVEDLYEQKLKHYKDEYKDVLIEARSDKLSGLSKFNAPLQRG